MQTEPVITQGPVLRAVDGGVARLRLNRPEASNGMDVVVDHVAGGGSREGFARFRSRRP